MARDRDLKSRLIQPQQPAQEDNRNKIVRFSERLADSLLDPQQYAVLGAEWRRGLKDLQTVLLGEWAGTHEEPGSIANPTQLEVYEEKHPDALDTPHHGLSAHAQASPLEQAREAVRERSHDKSKHRSIDIG